MNKIDFKDFYVEDVLKDIKSDISRRISLDYYEKENINRGKIKATDKKMREVLKDILVNNNNNGTGDNLEKFGYNFLLLRNSSDGEAKSRLRVCLILYYVAMYFDNVDLLQKMINLGVDLERNIVFLDSNLTSLFDEDRYVEMVKDRNGSDILANIGYSTLRVECLERNNYLRKFASIMKKRPEFIKTYGTAWLKETFDTYDEETYLKASISQVNEIIGHNKYFSSDVIKLRINKLIQETDFTIGNTFFASKLERLFNLFTDEELLAMDDDTIKYLLCAADRNVDIDRVKSLVAKRPNIVKFLITCDADFLNTFSDDKILSMSEKALDAIEGRRVLLSSDKLDIKSKIKLKKLANM